MKMTRNQVLGTKFEVWLEHLLKGIGYHNVMRNVEFHKSRNLYRQIDLKYDLINDNKIEQVLVEAKFSSNGSINYTLRGGVKTKSGQKIPVIANLVDEVYEKSLFVGAGISVLVTNTEFDYQIQKNAAEKGIITIDGLDLAEIYKTLGGSGSVEDSIYRLPIERKHLNRNIIYIN